MSRLNSKKTQRIKSDKPILVTLNQQLNRLPSKQEIIKKLSFRHPVLDKNYLKEQQFNPYERMYKNSKNIKKHIGHMKKNIRIYTKFNK